MAFEAGTLRQSQTFDLQSSSLPAFLRIMHLMENKKKFLAHHWLV